MFKRGTVIILHELVGVKLEVEVVELMHHCWVFLFFSFFFGGGWVGIHVSIVTVYTVLLDKVLLISSLSIENVFLVFSSHFSMLCVSLCILYALNLKLTYSWSVFLCVQSSSFVNSMNSAKPSLSSCPKVNWMVYINLFFFLL